MPNLTPRQMAPVTFSVTIDQATALSLAFHAKHDPSQFAAGLLIRTCKTAAALGCNPADVPVVAAAASIITTHKA